MTRKCSCANSNANMFYEDFGGGSTGTSSGGEFGSALGTNSVVGQVGIDANPTTPGIVNNPQDNLSYTASQPSSAKFYTAGLHDFLREANINYIENTFSPENAAIIVNALSNPTHTVARDQNIPGTYFSGLNRPLSTIKSTLDQMNQKINNGWTVKEYGEFKESRDSLISSVKYDTPEFQNVSFNNYIARPERQTGGSGFSSVATSIPTYTNINRNINGNGDKGGYSDENVQFKDLTEEQLNEYKKKFKNTFGEISPIDVQQSLSEIETKRRGDLIKENFGNSEGYRNYIEIFGLITFFLVFLILGLKIFKII
jgi:hypothetical protein